jgi:hypothetical protein
MPKHAQVYIGGSILTLMFEQGSTHNYRVERQGLPKDARLIGGVMADNGRGLILTFASEDFADVAGPPWPKLDPLLSHAISHHGGKLP